MKMQIYSAVKIGLIAAVGGAMGLFSGPGCAGGAGGAKPSAPSQPAVAKTDAGSAARPTGAGPVFDDPVAISDLREKALGTLVKSATDADAQVRANAIELASIAPTRLQPLIASGLADPNLGVRTSAAMVVGRSRITVLAGSVRPLLNDSSPFVRAAAIYALDRCGEKVDPTPISRMLLSDPSIRVRSHAAFVLGEMGNASAVGLLKQSLRERATSASRIEIQIFQLQVAEALVKLGEQQQVETIRAALYPSQPEDLDATALAVQILGLVRDRGAIDNLIYLSTRRNASGQLMPAEIRLGVAAALARMGMTEGGFIADEYALSENPAIRAQVALTYGETGRREHLAKLDRFLADGSAQVRTAAAGAILRALDAGAGRAGPAVTP